MIEAMKADYQAKGERLLSHARALGWSDAAIGEAVGRHEKTVYRWRTRRTPIRRACYLILSKSLPEPKI